VCGRPQNSAILLSVIVIAKTTLKWLPKCEVVEQQVELKAVEKPEINFTMRHDKKIEPKWLRRNSIRIRKNFIALLLTYLLEYSSTRV
jgi:hypothetical protein